MAAVKTSPPRSTASPASSPEATAPEQAQPVAKKKGGRKPVYATQEERKMRNRAAQAAFRERRTEYIKHLELTIKHHEEQLAQLQNSSRSAADEVLMLRYKNSLLERILMEKGIDVTAELRAVHNTHYDDRSNQVVATSSSGVANVPPLQPLHRTMGQPKPPVHDQRYMKPAPTTRHTSPSGIAMPTPPQASFVPPQTTQQEFHTAYYPTPYEAHMEELEQEYDAELLDGDSHTDGNSSGHSGHPSGHPPNHPSNHSTGGHPHTPDADLASSGANMSNAPNVPGVMAGGPGPNLPNMVSVSGPGGPGDNRQPYSATAGMFDQGFEGMFNDPQAPKHDAGLTDIMRQYNQMPFSFATSNLR
ncbi:hypothetical protein FPQ18DRAFT_332163 [Pyronema domesticum]|nr:hypothetical protein FPQ18DRAFT_332163 [Pyronema domesticum]